MITRRKVGLGMALGALHSGIRSAWASTWPPANQVIRMVVPFTAGGATDILGRMMAEGLRRELGVNVLVENIAGANGNLNHDPLTAFAHVALVAELPNVLMVRNQLGVNSVAELVALAKGKDLSFASPGVGSSAHVSAELFNLHTKIKLAIQALRCADIRLLMAAMLMAAWLPVSISKRIPTPLTPSVTRSLVSA